MSWDTIKDCIILFIGTFFAVIELVKAYRKKRRLIFTGLLLLIAVFLWLGIDQIIRHNSAEENTQSQISNLVNDIKTLRQTKASDSLNRIADSTNNAEFQKKLLALNIKRDSATNSPVPVNKTYNTHINQARDVTIGDH